MQAISDAEFGQFQQFIFDAAGITMSKAKKALVCGRLGRRLQVLGLSTYAAYYALLASGDAPEEVQTAVDLLTTNETYFFREAKHFDQLRDIALAARRQPQPLRVWSAASSSGEEAYSAAMVLDDCLGEAAWEVLGTDISMRMLERARTGHFTLERARLLPQPYLKRFCLRGTGEQEGTLLVERRLRSRVKFVYANLNTRLPALGNFDVIFLRNVMIYFSGDTKRQVVERVIAQLKPGGHFFIGHSETLNDINGSLHQVAPSIYRKP